MSAALGVFLALFVLVTGLGFWASRWRPGDLNLLSEWGLGGRRFGSFVTWFLLGGDLYTAYTFIAVPALVFGQGALGFFALPYTIIMYPVMFVIMPRLWTIARERGYVTAADFVEHKFDCRMLGLLVAITGILATMPYIALQLVGLQVVLAALHIGGSGTWADAPLVIAFVILAAYTYTGGLRAPALIAIVKDILIYTTVLTAIIVIPAHLGGWAGIFGHIPAAKLTFPAPPRHSTGIYSGYATLALGSALALMMYPHTITGVLGAKSAGVVQRNAVFLPAYSFILGLLALFGYMAYVAHVNTLPQFQAGFKAYGPSYAVPALLMRFLPSWFVGFAFAAIAIGALVPAAIMSVAAANLFTRNIYKAFLDPGVSATGEARTAKLASLFVKLGALAFVLGIPEKYAIMLQLLGGVWIIQTFPAIVIGLYTRWPHRYALVLGWLVGMIAGTGMVASLSFKGVIYPLVIAGHTFPAYAALYALAVNLAVTVVGTWVFNVLHIGAGQDGTLDAQPRGA
ncbi:MAG: monocarboxylate uptake permease MctP [Acidiferrobacter thiooxydans]